MALATVTVLRAMVVISLEAPSTWLALVATRPL